MSKRRPPAPPPTPPAKSAPRPAAKSAGSRTANLAASPPAPIPAVVSDVGRRAAGFAPLVGMLVLYAVLTLGLIIQVPFGAAPDENEHFEYVQYVAEHGRLPVFQRTGGNGSGYEFHQPPAYYVVSAVAYKVSPPALRKWSARGVSLLCGLATLLCAWFGVAALFPRRTELPILATGLLALSPLHQGAGATASNDALAGLLGAAIFCTIARLSARSARPFDAALLGLLAGLAVLSKGTALMLAPICVGAAWHLGPKEISGRARDALLCSAVLLAACGPWLWRNQALYGDPLALGAFTERFADNASRIQNFRGLGPDAYMRAWGLVFFCTLWGLLGGPNTAISLMSPFGTRGPVGLLHQGAWATFSTLLLLLCCAIVTICAALGLARSLQDLKSWPPPAKRALLWWLAGIFLVLLAFMRFNTEFFQPQARYLHPAIVPLSLAFALGWRELFGRRVWIAAAAVAIVLLSIWSWNFFGWRTLY